MISDSSRPGPMASSTVLCGKYVITRTNGCPAVAANLPDDSGRHIQFGLMVLTLAGGSIMTSRVPRPALFAAFGLPECL
jgi:hypothetical protein